MLAYIYVRIESQRVKVRLVEYIKPKQTNIWPYVYRALLQLSVQGKMVPVLEEQNSVCPIFCQKEPDLSRVGLPGMRKMRLVDLL